MTSKSAPSDPTRGKVKEMVPLRTEAALPGRRGGDQISMVSQQIDYGHLPWGGAAAQTYFGKLVEELTLAECAMLVPCPRTDLNPHRRARGG
jgi:hypothetical protein